MDHDTGISWWTAHMPGGGLPRFLADSAIGQAIAAYAADPTLPAPDEMEVWRADTPEARQEDLRRQVAAIPGDFPERAGAEAALRGLEYLLSHEGRGKAADTGAPWLSLYNAAQADLEAHLMAARLRATKRGRKKGPVQGGKASGGRKSAAAAERYQRIIQAAARLPGGGHGWGEIQRLALELDIPARTIRRALSKENAATK